MVFVLEWNELLTILAPDTVCNTKLVPIPFTPQKMLSSTASSSTTEIVLLPQPKKFRPFIETNVVLLTRNLADLVEHFMVTLSLPCASFDIEKLFKLARQSSLSRL